MQRALIGGELLLLACGVAMAQTRDPRVDELTRETAQLRRTAADQERRIAELEKTVRGLQAVVTPAPTRIPPDTPPWQSASNWNLVRKGMSEAQVIEILGPPTRVQSVIDTRTLLYSPDARSTATLNGSVTLTDDRVAASVPPRFANAAPTRIPPETPPWYLASNWNLIKKGMSEAQVTETLGSPARVESVNDVRTLYYQSDSRAATTLNGSVTLMDDRVTASSPPRF
jgi:hypothetical protein